MEEKTSPWTVLLSKMILKNVFLLFEEPYEYINMKTVFCIIDYNDSYKIAGLLGVEGTNIHDKPYNCNQWKKYKVTSV